MFMHAHTDMYAHACAHTEKCNVTINWELGGNH